MLAGTETRPSVTSQADPAVAAENATRALRATDPLAGWSFGQRSQSVHEGGTARLLEAALSARSPSLAKAIREAMEVKAENHRLNVEHSKTCWLLDQTRASTATDTEAEAIAIAEGEAGQAWERHLKDSLEVAANKVLIAPVADLDDVLIRSNAYQHVMGVADPALPNCLPDCEEDLRAMYEAMRDGVVEIIQRDYVKGQNALDSIDPTQYRDINDRLDALCDQEEAAKEGRVFLDDAAMEELQEALTAGYAEKDRQADIILAGPAKNLSDLLLQFEVVCDLAFCLDVSTYAVRDKAVGDVPMTTGQMNLDGAQRRSLAHFAASLAHMRDRQMPTDWRMLWDSVQHLHPNSRDAARRAYDAHLPAAGLKSIQLDGRPDHKLPVFTFEDRHHRPGFVTVGPDAAHDWSPVK